uniref:Uncharacterized protein n=1 Tax=Arundo donax TaxID=35708 RepID=A0A0A8ZCC1_ARUDO
MPVVISSVIGTLLQLICLELCTCLLISLEHC